MPRKKSCVVKCSSRKRNDTLISLNPEDRESNSFLNWLMFIFRRSSFENCVFKLSFGNILKLSFASMDETGVYRLDKQKFDTVIKVPSVRVSVENISHVAKSLSDVLFRARHIKNMRDTDDHQKVLLLNPDKCPENTLARVEFESRLQKLGIDLKTWTEEDVHVTYENATLDDALKKILPSNSDGFGGFSNIGHIVHVNLKETMLPYKYAIGMYDVKNYQYQNINELIDRCICWIST